MQKLPIDLVHLARTRHGVVAASELHQHGLDRSKAFRVARSGVLVRLFPETYVVASLVDPFTRAAAIQLRYPDLILERRAAAAIWGLDGFRPSPGSVEPIPLDLVRTDGPRCRSLPARSAWVPPNEIVTYLGYRVTTASWTVADLSAVPGITPDLIELAVESAMRSGLTTDDAMRVLADSYGPRWRTLQVVLSRRHAGMPATESYAETRFLQDVVRPLGLEDPERQVPIFVTGRPEPYRADFVFRRRSGALDVEIDGLAWHGRDSVGTIGCATTICASRVSRRCTSRRIASIASPTAHARPSAASSISSNCALSVQPKRDGGRTCTTPSTTSSTRSL